MMQKAAAMGNWWLAAASWQCACTCIMSHVQFFCKTPNRPADSVPLQPSFGSVWLLPFPKTKITFEREEISDYQGDSGKQDRAVDGDWENCVRSQGAYFEGNWGVSVLCTMFLYLVSSSIKVFIFHITWLDTFWTDLCPSLHTWLREGLYHVFMSRSVVGTEVGVGSLVVDGWVDGWMDVWSKVLWPYPCSNPTPFSVLHGNGLKKYPD